MVKKVRLKSTKKKKFVKKAEPVIEIVKQQLTEEERKEKLRTDLLKIAKRYEDMRLYDDAIKYYKKLDRREDVMRVENIKREIYISKAREFENNGKYADAARLYENLKMDKDLNRVNQLQGLGNSDDLPAQEIIGNELSETNKISSENMKEPLSSEPHLDISTRPVENEVGTDTDISQGLETNQAKNHQQNNKPQNITTNNVSQKIFKICPYCGEDLNLPKNPNFCPYCKETFV